MNADAGFNSVIKKKMKMNLMTLFFIFPALICVVAVLSRQTNGLCKTDADCTGSNTVCVSGSCECEQGFTIVNGKCELVLGRTCLDHVDCDDGRTVCVNSKCQCLSLTWREDNGKCVAFYGIPCTTMAHCGVELGYECINNSCNCSSGYEYTKGICEKVLGRQCTQNSAQKVCSLEHSSCKKIGYSGYKCRCDSGYTEKDGECIQVLGSSCEDVTCGNSMHNSYENLQSNYRGDADSWQRDFSSYHFHLTCGTDNVCNCNHGFIADGILCTPVFGRACSIHSDCGNYPGYTCNMQTKTCDCITYFHPFVRPWNYKDNTSDISNDHWDGWKWPAENVRLCIPEIGQNCATVNCLMENSYCNEFGMCACAAGFTETSSGTCEEVLGMTCVRETLCQIVDGGTCGEHNICLCKDGYVQNGSLCQKVLGSDCISENDCNMTNGFCKAGKCTCMNGFKENSYKCLREDCATNVRLVPDFHRRSVYRKSLADEPIIDDSSLEEGWYSIGNFYLHASRTVPDPGHCSTYYPIYMTANLTTDQIESMKSGNVSVSAIVGRLDMYEQSENITILMRNCGTETQIYIKPPKTKFSGLCFGTENHLNISRSNMMHALVAPDLLFERKRENNRSKYTPYVVFSCLPSEIKARRTLSVYPHHIFQNVDDIFFYNVHWYLNDVHFKSFGPVKKRNIVSETSVFEAELLDAGFKLGDEIRCSLEISQNYNSQIVLLADSERYLTGMQEIYQVLHLHEDNNDGSRSFSANIPLGCETFDEDDGNYQCEMLWPAIVENDETSCIIKQSGQKDGKLCGFLIKGYSYMSYFNHTGSWRNDSHFYRNRISYNNDTHSIDTYQQFSDHIEVENGTVGWNFKIKFALANISTGHQLWEGYRLPFVYGHIIADYELSICSIDTTNVPVLQMYHHPQYMSDIVALDTVGEFILYRSRTSPVEIHIETEECTSTVSRICICGWSYRNGEDIYVLSNCNGVRRFKQVYGDKINRDIEIVVFINGAALYKNPYSITNNGQAYMIGSYPSRETLDSGEGLCTSQPGKYTHRNGTIMSTSEGFASSWRLPAEESLYDSRNFKRYSWSQEYMLCYCPSDTKEREVTRHYNYTYGNYTYINEEVNVYLSYHRCSTENLCRTEIIGEDWPDSLLPTAVVKKVTARMEVRFRGSSPLLHLICDFDTQKQYFYKIQWTLGGEVIYQTEMMSADVASEFYITNDNITTSKFLLEESFSCEVSVYNESQNMFIGAASSDEIKAIEIAKTEVLMRRGRDATIQLKLNVPLVCKKDTICFFDFKLFDPNESHNCSDSTIAIKDQNTCGKRIAGVLSEADLANKVSVVNITLTTKNNDLYELRDTFTVKIKISTSTGTPSTYQEGTFSKIITVFVRDDERYWQGNYCYANNDPRMRTFDGQYYSNMLVDEFIMMKHKRLPVEVQLETSTRGWYSCGVTMRAGRDVFTINHCHGDHVTGYLLADDKILKVRKRDEHRYQIYFPHGTLIDVMISSRSEYMVNVYIYPSPADMNEVEGLCGNFDGKITGDLIHSDGNVTNSNNYYWWWNVPNPDVFIQSWGLNSTNTKERSLTDIEAIEETLESWSFERVLCVCMGNDGNGEVKCSASEQNTCVSPAEKPGEDVSISVRQKRSGYELDKEYKRRMRKMKETRYNFMNSATHALRPRSTGNVEAAIDLCNSTLSSTCGIMAVKDKGLNVTFEELVYNCGQDTAASSGTDWTSLTCQVMQANVEKELHSDVQFNRENAELVSDILANLCVGNCSGHGTCQNGSCVCFPGFKASDCSLDLSKRVVIKGITGDGICDVNKYDCKCIRLTTSGSSNDSVYTLEHKQLRSDHVWKTIATSNGTVEYDNFNEVFVCPEKSRTLRSASEMPVLADQYVIALSNDGTRFGDNSTVVLLDTRCLKVDKTSRYDQRITLMDGFCNIGGVCYVSKAQSTSDSCLFCSESSNPYDWTRDNTGDCSAAEEITRPYLLFIIGGVFIVVAIIVVVAVVVIVRKMK